MSRHACGLAVMVVVCRGVLTPEEFVAAGDQLVFRCPTWTWCVSVETGGDLGRRQGGGLMDCLVLVMTWHGRQGGRRPEEEEGLPAG